MDENKRTTSYLVSKAWYRLLKVVFLFTLLLSLVGWNIAISSDPGFTQVNRSKTLVNCTYGENKSLTLEQIDITLYPFDFRNGFNYKSFFEDRSNEYKIKQIFKSCYPQSKDDIDIFAAQKVYEVVGNERLKQKQDVRSPLTEKEKTYLDETIPKIEALYSGTEKAKYLDYSVQLFTIKPVETHTEYFLYLFLGNLSILLVFELVRRIFYYIVLGKLRPEKK